MTNTLILKAAHFAAEKHIDQRRKDKHASPYIIHPISVALAITQIGGVDDPEILAAALLHDTLEDTDTKPEELEAKFGKKVCEYVLDVSDNKTLPKDERKSRQIEHAKKISKGRRRSRAGILTRTAVVALYLAISIATTMSISTCPSEQATTLSRVPRTVVSPLIFIRGVRPVYSLWWCRLISASNN